MRRGSHIGTRITAALVVLASSPAMANTYADLDVDGCVEIALSHSAEIERAEAKVEAYRARLRQVEAIFYPKLRGMAFIAPMYTVEGSVSGFERRYDGLDDWGPYAHLEAILAQPLYTFGRAEDGEKAAQAQIKVEQARVREARNAVAREVRRLYYSRLYTASMKPAIVQAESVLEKAIERAQRIYDEATGEVSFADLSRLRFAKLEIDKVKNLVEYYETISLAALKHTMGLPNDVQLTFSETRLPALGER
jgi:outer membrane protein TolC